jgi:predicted CopG family antitoxin
MVKTITIREEVYAALTKVKKKDESFSELLDRLLKSTSSIGLLTKLKGSIELKQKTKILSEIYSKRLEMR